MPETVQNKPILSSVCTYIDNARTQQQKDQHFMPSFASDWHILYFLILFHFVSVYDNTLLNETRWEGSSVFFPQTE